MPRSSIIEEKSWILTPFGAIVFDVIACRLVNDRYNPLWSPVLVQEIHNEYVLEKTRLLVAFGWEMATTHLSSGVLPFISTVENLPSPFYN